MGRGRQKAKNTKVARELKYFSPDTDLSALQAELAPTKDNEPDYEDKWADLYPDEEVKTATQDPDSGSASN
jgi:hypothetical protein